MVIRALGGNGSIQLLAHSAWCTQRASGHIPGGISTVMCNHGTRTCLPGPPLLRLSQSPLEGIPCAQPWASSLYCRSPSPQARWVKRSKQTRDIMDLKTQMAQVLELLTKQQALVALAAAPALLSPTPVPAPVSHRGDQASELRFISGRLLQISDLQGQTIGWSLASLVVARRQLLLGIPLGQLWRRSCSAPTIDARHLGKWLSLLPPHAPAPLATSPHMHHYQDGSGSHSSAG
ncbi:UNVERIFIED_CONTAM: hypothetical protein FKN15_001302 [Acipenser sinensis]